MKVVLLAGGLGTKLAEETSARPKPLVEIGGRPILWHIMKIFSASGIYEFIICVGYKGYMIKEYFANYRLHNSNIVVDVASGRVELDAGESEPWRITIVDTGENTMTGGRLKRVLPYIGNDEEFIMTYGDGVADIDVAALIAHHKAEGRAATVTGAQPPGRFGQLGLRGNEVIDFLEKPESEGGWINAGFFILPKWIGDYISGDPTTFEREPLERLTRERQLTIYKHTGFWLPMDTLREKMNLEEMWRSGNAPWKVW